MTAIGIGFEWHSGHPRGLRMGVAPDSVGEIQQKPARRMVMVCG
jgi:hypothetical protein